MALLKSINLAGNISTLPTKLSEFENDPGFITAADIDLTNYYTQAQVDNLLSTKQDTLTPGTNVTIVDGVISATDTTYTAGTDISIVNGVISSTIDTTQFATNTALTTGLASKADAATTYTKTEVDGLLGDKADASSVYTKTEADTLLADKANQATTYTKDEVDALIDDINTGRFEVVQELPQEGEDKVIYLVPNDGEAQNIYDEYIWVNNAFEKIGTTEIDLSGYYTSAQTDALLADKADANSVYTKSEMDTALAGKQGSLTAGTNITIVNDVISATDTTYTAGQNINITNNEISADLSNVYTKAETDTLLDEKQDALTAGSHITIADDGTISATGMTKQEIITALGYQEITLSTTTDDGTVTAHVLGYVDEPTGNGE